MPINNKQKIIKPENSVIQWVRWLRLKKTERKKIKEYRKSKRIMAEDTMSLKAGGRL